jgi:Fur family zinc uptake transcriptional regulator
MTGPKREGGRSKDQLIARTLRDAHRPLSAYDLIELLRDQGVNAPTTVYRALNRLIAAGQVHRIESLSAFVCCTGSCRREAVVFAICETCGTVTEFDDEVIAGRLTNWVEGAKFSLRQTTIELRGRCETCRTEAPLVPA